MKNNFFYSLIVLLVLVFNSCSFFEQKEPKIDFEIIKQKALDAEHNSKVDSAFYYLNTISNDENYIVDNRVYSKLEKARLYYLQCDYIESEAETIEALDINTNPAYNSFLHNMLGTAFQEQRKFDKAIEQLFLASKNTTDSLHNAVIQNNLSLVYLDNEEYNKAIQTLEPLLNNKALKDNPFYFSKVVDNLGYAYLKKRLPAAKTFIEKGLQLRDSIDDNFSKIASYVHLANYFEQQSDVEKTNEFALKAYSIATTSKSPDDRLEALDLLIKNNSNNKEWYLKYAHINDSIQKDRNINKNQFAQIKYNATKAENKAKLNEQQKEKLTIAIVAIILLSFISFILIRIKNKQKQLKAVYDTETRISKQLHDELANDVFNTLTFIETQDISTPENKEKIVNEIVKIYKQTRSISYENSSIEVGAEYSKELRVLLNNFTTPEIQVTTKGIESIDWSKVIPVKKIAIYRILQELMINMKKHSECSLVFVAIRSNNNTLEIKYSDNGIGLNQENFKIGLQNVENRIESIKGTITFESINGLKVKINIPI